MARGWESKDVESQQELAGQRARDSQEPQLTPEQVSNRRERGTLLLDQTRLQTDLASARHPRHQDMIRQALAHVELKLEATEEK